MTTGSPVRLRGLRKSWGDGVDAVAGIDLDVAAGEFVVLVGPSGCGKSTVLRMIAGLEEATAGTIVVGGDDVTTVPPQERDVAMVFQSYALYPHKTVRENLGFGLRLRGMDREGVRVRVEATAAALELSDLLDRRPGQLSGGQRQRVALGRAMVREPRVFLLDEPLSNLDAALRASTRLEIARLHQRLGATMIYVTHDQEEAMTLGDRLVVMRAGQVEQVGTPMDVYENPASLFVAGFVGSPAMNLLPATVTGEGATRIASAGELRIEFGVAAGRAAMQVVIGVRPHEIRIAGEFSVAARGRVEIVERLGSADLVHVAIEGVDDLLRVTTAPGDCGHGQTVEVGLPAHGVRIFDVRSGACVGRT